MKTLALAVLMAAVLLLPAPGPAQETLPPPPANWGELAELLVEAWDLDLHPNPTGGHAAVNALNLVGVGKGSYDAIMGVEGEDLFPANPDGYDPDNWLPEQELTGEFMCMLKMVVWAATYAGLIPYYDVPTSSGPDDPLTPEEEIIVRETAELAVVDLITMAQRDGVCEAGDTGALCYYCAGRNGPCWWAPCP